MYPSDINNQFARERYNDRVAEARRQRLIRAARAAQQPASRSARRESLFVRIFAALRPRHAARA